MPRPSRLGALVLLAGLISPLLVTVSVDPAAAAPSAASRFEPVDPTRLLDTRTTLGGHLGKVPANTSVTAPLGTTVPANATAVVLNVTVVDPEAFGYITAYSGATRPGTSNANVDEIGEVAANLVIVPLITAGDVRVFTSMTTNLVVDLAGFFVPAAGATTGRYRTVDPAVGRVLDTRNDGGVVSVLTGRQISVTGRAGVPATGVRAVALNVTLTAAITPGWMQVMPTGGSTIAGASSNVNVTHADQTVANLVMVPVGANGTVTLVGTTIGHIVVDVAGWFTDSTAGAGTDGLFVAVDPVRLVDTRSTGAPATQAKTLTVNAAAAGVDAANLGAVFTNLTLTEPAMPGFVTGYSGVGAVPTSSNINADRAGATVANAGIVPTNGATLGLYPSMATHLVVDLLGYFTRSGAPPPPPPAGSPGSVVSAQTGAAGVTLRYRSIGVRGDLQEQLTMMYVPAGNAPAGGWPIFAMVHAPLGLGDKCAISNYGYRPDEVIPWVAAGYVVVYPDLEGIGVPGRHPYMHGTSTAHSVLDAARAARAYLGASASNRVGIWGLSSGGHGALWAGELASVYAPDLDVRGIVSLDPVEMVSFMLNGLWDQGGFSPWVVQAAVLANPALQYGQVMTPAGIAMLDQINEQCENESYSAFDALPGRGMHTNPFTLPAWLATIQESDPGRYRSAPILLTGGTDHTAAIGALDHNMHLAYQSQMCSLGTSVQFRIFVGDHLVGMTPWATQNLIAWLNSQMTGPAQTGCSTTGPIGP